MEKTVPTETEICFRGDKSFLQAAARNVLSMSGQILKPLQ